MEEKNENKISHSFAQNTLFDYKKKIFLNVSICFVICIILVSERVFNSTFITWELDYIDYVQKYLVYSFNLNPDFLWLYKSVGSLGDFRILTLFMTHIFISVYVGFDVIIGLKVLLVHCVSLYFFTILEIIYQGPRPFWIGEGFITLYCDNSFTNPSSVTFVFFLDGSYLFLLYLKNTKEKRLLEHINTSLGEEIDENSIKKKTLLFKISVALGIVLAHFTLFLRYLIGLVFILDYFMGLLYFAIFFSLMTKFDNYIDKLLKSSTLLKKNARQLVFAWITFLIFANLFAYVIYLCCKKNIPVLWMKNFVLSIK